MIWKVDDRSCDAWKAETSCAMQGRDYSADG